MIFSYVFYYTYKVGPCEHVGVTNYTIAVPRLDRLKVGDEIDILYDPEHPERSVWPMG